MSNKKIVFIVTEGETDDLFYKKILEVLKNKTPNNRFSLYKIKYICIKGFGKFESKLNSKFKKLVKEYKRDDKNTDFFVFLCYDNDIFIGKKNPPIDPVKIEKDLKKNGANEVFHIVANKCIEDFFLYDFEGICRYLKLKGEKKTNYKSLIGLKQLYKKVGKAYIKGSRCDALLNQLDFELIEEKICLQLSKFCEISGIDCSRKNKVS